MQICRKPNSGAKLAGEFELLNEDESDIDGVIEFVSAAFICSNDSLTC